VKISSGSLRGMGIIMPKNQITRPTLSRVREAVFNILTNHLEDAVFWDLFSGSGAVGLTALSMGARECVFVEQDRPAIAALTRNIQEAKERFLSNGDGSAQTTLMPTSLVKAWRRLLKMAPPDIIWADPPYSESVKWAQHFQQELANFVKDGALLVMEMQTEDLDAAEKGQNLVDPQWELVKTRKYGGCSIVIWRRNERNQQP
jgi:16S rRNA (guanine966-N2)-methyltransferase